MMRECLLQLSGPWPPYHFVHRLTRSAHAHAVAARPAGRTGLCHCPTRRLPSGSPPPGIGEH
jgi:hypothetical protein